MTHKIKFSHIYKKLWGQTSAQLINVRLKYASNLHRDLIEYDTTYIDKNSEDKYPLPKKGRLIQLTFIGDKGIPFCTLRPYNPNKFNYYNSLLNNFFEVVMIK